MAQEGRAPPAHLVRQQDPLPAARRALDRVGGRTHAQLRRQRAVALVDARLLVGVGHTFLDDLGSLRARDRALLRLRLSRLLRLPQDHLDHAARRARELQLVVPVVLHDARGALVLELDAVVDSPLEVGRAQ
eukprot:1080309-Prymnesium_polylepis.1